MKRRSPPFALVLAICAFVFAQLLGAAHACEMAMGGSSPAKAAAAAHSAADCCDEGQPAPDAACDNHCEQAYKAPERVSTGAAAATAVLRIAMPMAIVRKADPPSRPVMAAPDLGRHTEPSISIRNCCFRI